MNILKSIATLSFLLQGTLLWGQTELPENSFRLTSDKYKGLTLLVRNQTTSVWDNFGRLMPWDNNSKLKAGTLNMTILMMTDHINFEPPTDAMIYNSLSTYYGQVVKEDNDNQKKTFELLEDGYYTDMQQVHKTMSTPLYLGGCYRFKQGINKDGLLYDALVDVTDEPSIRQYGDTELKTGKELNMAVYFNTGYPYVASIMKGDEKGELSIYKANEDDTPGDLVKQEKKDIRMTDLDKDKIAHRDSITLNAKLPVGKYFGVLKHNWAALGDDNERHYVITVNDTLRVKHEFDKPAYDHTVDKQAVLRLSLDRGYPFIGKGASDTISTVRVRYFIDGWRTDSVSRQFERYNKELDITETFDSMVVKNIAIVEDTITLAHDSLATRRMNETFNIPIDLTRISVKDIYLMGKKEDGQTDDLPRKLMVEIEVSYEGKVQYNTKIPLVIKKYDLELLATRKYLKGKAAPLVCIERHPLGASINERYSGEELVPGLITSTVNFSVSKADLPVDLPKAQKEDMYLELYDKNGHLILAQTDNMEDPMSTLFEKARETTEIVSMPFTQRFPIFEGGEYRIVVNAPFAAYTHTEDFTVKSVPEYTFYLPPESAVKDTRLFFYAYFTTGFPYQPEQFADNLYARYTLTNAEGTVIKQQNKALNFAQPTNTHQAVCDTIGFLDDGELAPGRYTLAYESNFETTAGRLSGTYNFDVTDLMVIKMKCSNNLPRPDEVINVNGVCRYGYPYIQPDEQNPKPTFQLHYSLTYADGKTDDIEVFDEGDLVYTDDSLAVGPINQRFSIPFDMKKVPAAYHNIPLELTVRGRKGRNWLGRSNAMTVKIVNAATAIKEIDDRKSRIESDIYDLQGRKVKPVTKGIYIVNGKKVVR